MASRTASAPWPANAGPLLTLGLPWSAMRGRCSSIVNRVVRSTRVPIAELPSPRMRSPSQWPGTARSSASGGRWLIMISGLTRRAVPRPWYSERAAGAQAGGQLAAQRPAALDIRRLVDRLVGDPHRPIIGEVDPQPVGDLLRAPGSGPTSVLAPAVTATDPAHLRARHLAAVEGADGAGEPVLHVLPQPVVRGELGGLGAPGAPVGMPLCGRGPVVQTAATGGGVAAELAGDRGGRSAQSASDRAHPVLLRPQQGDLLAVGKRQVAPRRRGQADRWHAASFSEPSCSHRRGHAAHDGGVLAGQPRSDLAPEPLLDLPLVDRGLPGRAHPGPQRSIGRTRLRFATTPLPHGG